MKIHSRTPVVSIQHMDLSPNPSPYAVFWEYPEDIKVYGMSLSGNLAGWSVAAELSHYRGVPAQIDGNDLLLSGLGAGGLVTGSPTAFGPYGQGALDARAGDGYQAGFTRRFAAFKIGGG